MRVRLGIIGCGNVTTSRHLPALSRVAGIQVAGVCDVDPARAQQAAATSSATIHVFQKVDDLVQDPGIDAVAVCVPTSLHREIAEKVIAARKHLYLEKPPAATLEDSAALCAAATKSPAVCMLGFNLRLHAHIQRAVPILQQGVLGRILLIRSNFTSVTRATPGSPEWRLNPRTGGLLLEQAIHHFDLWRHLAAHEVEDVHAVASADWAEAGVLARLQNGVPVCGSFSERTTETNEIEIFCEQGILRMSLYEFDGFEIIPMGVQIGSPYRRIRRAATTVQTAISGLKVIRRGGEYIATYQRAWEHFAACIREGRIPAATLQDGHRALEIVMAVRNSAEQRIPVRLQSTHL